MSLFRRDDRARFDGTVAIHLDAAYNLARWLLNDPNDAEDAVQEASLRAFRAIRELRGDNAKPWFLAIVRNTCMNTIRSKAARGKWELEEDIDMGVAPDPTPSAEQRLLRDFDAHRIREAIAALPPNLREVIVLREFEEMSYLEIADVAGIARGTVMSRLSRARDRLMLTLAREGYGTVVEGQ